MSTPLDMDHLSRWIGRTQTAEDTITPRLVGEYEATFAPHGFAPEGAAPLGIHWCLAPAIEPADRLGPDGHPARGGFLPPVPLRRRMWAGGEITFLAPLKPGDHVTRRSRIADVVQKNGRAGPMVFVTVRHDYATERGTAIRERQDIVYLDPAPHPAKSPAAAQADHPAGAHRATVEATSTLLFRYSAMTFNGHRIHYDQTYAREVEGYPDLVVHGPMQAAFLLQFGARLAAGRRVAGFRYRGQRPLFANEPLVLNADAGEAGLSLWTSGASPRPAMKGDQTFTD